ncbi:MAG: hypothetical protein REI64_03480 [Pedobacter sp.]|uniref:hypothetical protein n=1 Tax=Pedobacter sp. TaxID=1411316 RepID=UPI002807038E|nr:hypothetical protein [Pedobacter sp.]MDQ8003835.1 hypothetical protein [Pedobacter sp.]
MKNKLTIHYVIVVAAFAIVIGAAYKLYQDQSQYRSLLLTIVACSIVGVGQIFIIRQKKKSANE